LLLVTVSVLFAPQTFSQVYTTVTTQSTVTTMVSQTNSQVNPVSSYTSTSTVEETIIQQTWTNPGIGAHACETTWEPFNATQGFPVVGNITANQEDSLVVYILSKTQFNAWRAADTCDPSDAQGSLWSAGQPMGIQLTTANVDWTPAKTGEYWILAQTWTPAPQVVLTVNLGTIQPGQTTVTLYSTLYSTTAYAFTQTQNSVMTQQLPQSQPNNGVSGMTLPLGIVVIVVLVLIGYLVVRRRKK